MKPSQHDQISNRFSRSQGSSSTVQNAAISSGLQNAVQRAAEKSQECLLQTQRQDGHWCGELEGDTILESEFILLLAFLKQETSTVAQRAARHILAKQLPAGGWSLYPGGDVDISCSVKAYFALKLTGHDTASDDMDRARCAILEAGGADRVNSFTRYYLAMLGQIDYQHCPAVPPEAMLLPKWFPINIYRVSAWSRTILVPLSIVWSQQPCRQLEVGQGINELFHKSPDNWPRLHCAGLEASDPFWSWEQFFGRVDRAQKWLEGHNIKPLRQRAVRLATEWMVKRFVASDGLGAIFPPIIWSIVALKSLGYDDESLELRYCHQQLNELIIKEGETVRLQPCKSPVWDSALALRALARHGTHSSQACVRKSIHWLLSKETTRRGDWSHGVDATPSGWFFEYHNDFYPDTDDTAMVVMALSDQFADSRLDKSDAPSGVSFIAANRASGMAEAREQVTLLDRAAAACERGRRWILAMQNRDGGWGAFDRNNDSQFLCHVPFADHNAMIDPSTPDITGRVIEMLANLGARIGHPAVDRGITYLKATQCADGCWEGRWGINYIYGTWQALTGMCAVDIDPSDSAVSQGVAWLRACQQESGGWGELPDSYQDPARKGCGPPTASQTAWALLGLMAADGIHHHSVERGIRYLLKTQTADGTWLEPEFTGTGFPRVFYLRYHMYPLYFPLLAMSEWLQQSKVFNPSSD